jgi:uncharacterized protein RhaS with RHS repeats
MQARYYDPVIGRFLSIDPVGFSPGRPDMFNRYAYAVNDPINMWDPFGECSYDDDGKAKSGICPDPNDSKAAEIVDTQLNDENSIASEIEGQLNEAGMIVFVSTREDIATTDSAATPPDPTLLGSPQANGSITIGLQPGSVTGTTTGSQVDGAIDLTVAEAFEHELSHVQDGLDGRANDNGPGIITASGAVVNVYRGGVNEGREEARAVNRTNLYRQKSGLGKQRTRY